MHSLYKADLYDNIPAMSMPDILRQDAAMHESIGVMGLRNVPDPSMPQIEAYYLMTTRNGAWTCHFRST